MGGAICVIITVLFDILITVSSDRKEGKVGLDFQTYLHLEDPTL